MSGVLLALPMAMLTALAQAPTTLPQATVTLAGKSFAVEVAATQPAQRHGLMGRHQLASNAGMWFVFDQAKPRFFWMENTPLSLDMVFFDATRKVVSYQLAVPPCIQTPCPLFPSGQPAKFVLEVPAGTVSRAGIKRGMVATVDHR